MKPKGEGCVFDFTSQLLVLSDLSSVCLLVTVVVLHSRLPDSFQPGRWRGESPARSPAAQPGGLAEMSRGLSDPRERYPRSAATGNRTPAGCWNCSGGL